MSTSAPMLQKISIAKAVHAAFRDLRLRLRTEKLTPGEIEVAIDKAVSVAASRVVAIIENPYEEN